MASQQPPHDELTKKIRLIAPTDAEVPIRTQGMDVNRLTAVPGGLDPHHRTGQIIRYADVYFFTVFEYVRDAQKRTYIDIFIAGERRPFRVHHRAVSYQDFLPAPDPNAQTNFYNFVLHLLGEVDSVCLDDKTINYLKTRQPPSYQTIHDLEAHTRKIWHRIITKLKFACPSCKEIYWVDRTAIPEQDPRLRCKKCQSVFPIKLPGAASAPIDATMASPATEEAGVFGRDEQTRVMPRGDIASRGFQEGGPFDRGPGAGAPPASGPAPTHGAVPGGSVDETVAMGNGMPAPSSTRGAEESDASQDFSAYLNSLPKAPSGDEEASSDASSPYSTIQMTMPVTPSTPPPASPGPAAPPAGPASPPPGELPAPQGAGPAPSRAPQARPPTPPPGPTAPTVPKSPAGAPPSGPAAAESRPATKPAAPSKAKAPKAPSPRPAASKDDVDISFLFQSSEEDTATDESTEDAIPAVTGLDMEEETEDAMAAAPLPVAEPKARPASRRLRKRAVREGFSRWNRLTLLSGAVILLSFFYLSWINVDDGSYRAWDIVHSEGALSPDEHVAPMEVEQAVSQLSNATLIWLIAVAGVVVVVLALVSALGLLSPVISGLIGAVFTLAVFLYGFWLWFDAANLREIIRVTGLGVYLTFFALFVAVLGNLIRMGWIPSQRLE